VNYKIINRINFKALLYLITGVTYTPTIRAINLPTNHAYPSGNAIAAGWGATGPLGVTLPNVLQHAQFTVLDIPTCRAQFNAANLDGNLVDYTNVCTAGHPGGKNENVFFKNLFLSKIFTGGVAVCSGDSGGKIFKQKYFHTEYKCFFPT
jgi:hypothetical protein